MKKVLAIFLLLTLAGFGCAPKKVAVTGEPEQQQQTGISSQETSKRDIKPEERITEQRLAKIESEDEIKQTKEESGRFSDIYFDFDMYDIRSDAKPVLEEVASWMLKNTNAKLLIEGHCDERGTNEYNLALGDRRGKAARDYLIALGVASQRIEIISYGEEKPTCTDQTEECWAKNRRAHFIIVKEPVK
ncbi:MAG: peptidoglycan-associated lipoprotein Pal [Nitrospirae bacterium]|nr:peptidoglycan-associated lipoprotein Pal [Nitrospirota bacterium]